MDAPRSFLLFVLSPFYSKNKENLNNTNSTVNLVVSNVIYLIQMDISRYKVVTSGVLNTENICLKFYRSKCYNSDTHNIEISLYTRYN